ncbi:hypothetical protein M0G43_08030 [Subsaxibacter sp. CAU 1640]|uniref:hypothetical protein n=1 Tax=Subsaxibacter sp. CAU 1640 TaxID=2933271 RepID=UPI0020067377|nr:hypothetical protein [Subsaxibacter sp. CAU 1640]MCK7590516.1 hypothetical protein [Subsaxibacter sp. CAU 1640]
MNQEFTTKERKKEFDKIFKQRIVPFLEREGFVQPSKTSKKVFQTLDKGLSVAIYFEFKNFGSGFYDISIAYYDEELGDEDSGNYLTIALIKKPTIKARSLEELHTNTDIWIDQMTNKIIPYIKKHNNHKAILNSEGFYFSKHNEQQCQELLQRKSMS